MAVNGCQPDTLTEEELQPILNIIDKMSYEDRLEIGDMLVINDTSVENLKDVVRGDLMAAEIVDGFFG